MKSCSASWWSGLPAKTSVVEPTKLLCATSLCEYTDVSIISSSSGNEKNTLSLAGWSCLRNIVNYTSSWVSVAMLFVSFREHFLLLPAPLATPPARPQNKACGNCRGRSGSLSEIMQIVTSAVRVLCTCNELSIFMLGKIEMRIFMLGNNRIRISMLGKNDEWVDKVLD